MIIRKTDWRTILVLMLGICSLCDVVPLMADELAVRFRRQLIDANCENSSCAAIDVDRDGRLDIVAGDHWYRAPNWERQRVRDVPRIRGRLDDYSSLPLDVNGDGLCDLVSVNYRSRSLYWVEQPSVVGQDWPVHVIDVPGSSETGRLYDINGDGRLDVLPNGTDYAAWYELALPTAGDEDGGGRDDDPDTQVHWVRHELPDEVAGHGIGFGDLDGDGRGDLVTSHGWFRGPQDAAADRWLPMGEFQLHRDASIPILIHDVDADGDQDVVWSRAHNIGVYWLEQVPVAAGGRKWMWHAIDTSVATLHAPLLADIDQDGQLDLLAGKRYLGHDGRDPDETSPLGIYCYRFDRNHHSWRRDILSLGGSCGWDLDPKCVDLDGDGDLDLLAPARCGLYLLENLGIDAVSRAADESGMQVSLVPQGEYARHDDVSYYADGGRQVPIATTLDWGLRRNHILQGMQRAMGEFPGTERRVPLDVQVESVEDAGNYVRQKITYVAEPGWRVPAFLLIPKSVLAAPQQRVPALLCLHPTHALGKAQICGLGGNPTRFYAHELAERGFVCLAPDYPSFGDYTIDFEKLQQTYASGTMKAVWDNVRALDLLESLPYVDPDRMGAIGHSLGGHNGLFTAAFDQRLRAVVTSCGFNAFAHYYGGDLTGWSSARYMPRIASEFHCDPKQMPFDFHEVIAAMAPRPLWINAPLQDDNFAVDGVRQAVDAASRVYKLYEKDQNLQVVYPEVGHDFPDSIRLQAYQWLEQQLSFAR
jgi:dienelactone hydrolase